jgi:hypothetical protein
MQIISLNIITVNETLAAGGGERRRRTNSSSSEYGSSHYPVMKKSSFRGKVSRVLISLFQLRGTDVVHDVDPDVVSNEYGC